jgi:hypothetical protein
MRSVVARNDPFEDPLDLLAFEKLAKSIHL